MPARRRSGGGSTIALHGDRPIVVEASAVAMDRRAAMKTKWGMAAGLAALVALGGASALAQQPGKGKQNRTAGDKVREVLPESEAVFTREERVVIGGNVILMKDNTAAIYDIIRGAIP